MVQQVDNHAIKYHPFVNKDCIISHIPTLLFDTKSKHVTWHRTQIVRSDKIILSSHALNDSCALYNQYILLSCLHKTKIWNHESFLK